MKRVVANYGRPHAKRPVETGGAEVQPKRACSPVATNPLVHHAQAGGTGFGSYVDKLVDAQASRAGAAGPSVTRQLKDHLKEQLEAEERRAAGVNVDTTVPAASVGADTDTEPKFCDNEMQTDACPLKSEPVLASAAVQVDTVPTVAIETQTDAPPEPQLDPVINCGTQTDPPPQSEMAEIGCQCDDEPAVPAAHSPPTDESVSMEQADEKENRADKEETQAGDPFAFAETEEEAAAPAPATAINGGTQQRTEEITRRKEELIAESAAIAERAALAEASEATAKLEKAQGQIVSLEFANDLLMQQVGEVKNQLKTVGDKELAARQALTKLQQDHEKEVARWQTMMDSTVQSVQGQMTQLIEGSTQKISVLQQQVQQKDAQLAQLWQKCADLEEAQAAAASADELQMDTDDAEMDADAIFAAVDSVEEEDEDEDEEEEEEEEEDEDQEQEELTEKESQGSEDFSLSELHMPR